MAGTILIAYDGSAHGKVALERAATLADEADTISVISVAPFDSTPADLLIRKNALAEAETVLSGSSASLHLIEATGSTGRAIVDEAIEGNANLVIVGSRGRGGLASTVLGSVSIHVVHHAPCDVLVVRGRD